MEPSDTLEQLVPGNALEGIENLAGSVVAELAQLLLKTFIVDCSWVRGRRALQWHELAAGLVGKFVDRLKTLGPASRWA